MLCTGGVDPDRVVDRAQCFAIKAAVELSDGRRFDQHRKRHVVLQFRLDAMKQVDGRE